jgi:hypothetical protein
MESIDRLIFWLQQVGSRAWRACPEVFVSLVRQLQDLVYPRVEIVLVSLTFMLTGLMRPESAWNGMRDAVTKTMVDSDH